ncbi:hypothetical protein ACHAWF_014062 [Thalassiosira exigua]
MIEEKKTDSPDAPPVVDVEAGDGGTSKPTPPTSPTPSDCADPSSAKDKDGGAEGTGGTNSSSEEEPLSAEDRASCLSSWLLLYLSPLLRLGATKVLEPADVGPPSKRDRAEACHAQVRALWKVEVEKTRVRNDRNREAHQRDLDAVKGDDAAARKKRAKLGTFVPKSPPLGRVLFRAFGRLPILYAVGLYVLSALLQFLPVLILNDLVGYFESPDPANYRALFFHPWGDVAGLFFFPLLVSLFQTRSQVILNHCAVFIRTSVSTLLFEKALSISAAGRAQTSTGQVVNMMSNDTQQLQRFLQFVGFTMVAPIQIILALVLIHRQVGNATWVGVAFMLCLVPVNSVVFSNVSKMRRKVLKYSDARVKMINEILAGIRIIKFYAWEHPFGKEVGLLRDKELKALTTLAYTTAIGFSLIMLSAPIVNPMLVFLAYINSPRGEGGLDAATAFTTIALFNIMRFPFAFLPMGFLQLVQSRIALRRLSKYLELSELEGYVEPGLPPDYAEDVGKDGDVLTIENDKADKKPDPAIVIKDGSFSWVDPNAVPSPTEPPKKKRVSRKERKESLRKEKEEHKRRESGTSEGGGLKPSASTGSLNRAESLASLGISMATLDAEKDTPESRIALRNVSCTIERGSLVAVVGTVGSGKSSFLSAILGEMEAVGGSKVHIPLSVGETSSPSSDGNANSYCSQSPWVVNDTLRGNILFGRPFDEERYEKVVKACALVDDLAVLPAGDMTEIGERGINLSGGQKARVALARAVYSPSSRLLLLDDPLSAVDAHVGEHLFREAVLGDVTSGATRILVTHHVHFLPRCDKVIVLEKGEVKHAGRYRDLVAQGVNFAGAVDVEKKEESGEAAGEDGDGKEKSGEAGDDKSGDDKANAAENDKLKKAGKKLVTDEEQAEGSVEGSMYSHYAKKGGYIVFASIFIIQGFGRASEVMANFWLSFWAEATARAAVDGTTVNTTFYLNIYVLFGMGGVLCLTVRALAMAVHRLRASRKLHDDLTKSILRAPVAFFDVTPTGRILNRFAADMDKIDLELTQSLGQAFSTLYSMLGAVSAIIAATKGTLLVALAPIGYACYVIQKWFRKSSTELQRAASVAASPIFTDFSQMLSGTATIRAYGKQSRFFGNCKRSFDGFNSLFSSIQQANFWLGLRLDVMGGSVGAIIGGIALATNDTKFIPAGWVGLALSYSIEVTGYLKHGVRDSRSLCISISRIELLS